MLRRLQYPVARAGLLRGRLCYLLNTVGNKHGVVHDTFQGSGDLLAECDPFIHFLVGFCNGLAGAGNFLAKSLDNLGDTVGLSLGILRQLVDLVCDELGR